MEPLPAAIGRIPLTVLGGFLGAGKTTLLNHWLRQAPPNTAVLVNDFGAISIDAALLRTRDAHTIALANGCVCCQIGDDLTQSLHQVLSRDPAPAWVVIEASGVSDPWRIAQVGLVDPQLTLDGVVVVVDATGVRAHAADPLLADTVQRQLRAADVLVLNKVDLVAAPDIAALHAWLHAQVPGVAVFEAVDAQVPMAAVSGIALHAHGAPVAPAPPQEGAPAHVPRYLGQVLPAPHGATFDAWTWAGDAPVQAAMLRRLLKAMPADVLRLKGVLPTDEHACAEVQYAGRRGSLRRLPPPPHWPGTGRVVAIGLRGRLPAQALADAFAQATVQAAAQA